MSVILMRTISATSQKRVVLSNSQDARPLPFGTSWTKCRIGIRLHMRDIAADIISTPRFALGLCSGTTLMYGDATVTHFVGIRTIEPTWTLTSSNRFLVNGSTLSPHKKVGSTITAGTAFFPGVQWGIGAGADNNAADRTVIFLDILKGNPNYTLQMLGWINTGSAPADVSFNTFRTQMEIATPVVTNHTFSAANTVAVNEGTNGVLDTVTFHWDRTLPEIEIEDIAVAKLS